MKKLLLLSVFAVIATLNINAQERDKGAIEIAPYVAYSSAFFNGDNVDAYETKSGVSYGVVGDYFFNDRWSIRSGVTYDAMGASIKGLGNDIDLDYISIPLNANWHFGSTRKWNLNFGLTPSFLTSAKVEGQEGDIKNEVESFQLGVSYGIGYKIEVSDTFSVLITGQGNVGVSNINKIEGSNLTQLNAFSFLGLGGVFKL